MHFQQNLLLEFHEKQQRKTSFALMTQQLLVDSTHKGPVKQKALLYHAAAESPLNMKPLKWSIKEHARPNKQM